jgi:hypothetical protein
MDPRLAEIRLVAANFRELRGLTASGLGAVNVLTFSGFLLFGPTRLDTLDWSLLMMLVCLAQGFLMAWMDRYYQGRFGAVEGGASSTRIVMSVGVVLALTLTLRWPSFGAVFIPFAMMELWIVIRDFPRRGYHLIGVAGALAALAVAVAADPLSPDRSVLAAIVIHGASLIVPGLLDHQLLVRSAGRVRSVV